MKKIKITLLIPLLLTSLVAFNYIFENYKLVTSNISDDIYEIVSNNDVFDVTHQQRVLEIINQHKKNSSKENPFLIYNPFGTNYNAINIYFNEAISNISYTIKCSGYEDYKATLESDEDDGYQIIGLISGKINTLTISVDNVNLVYTLNMPTSLSDIDNQIDYEDGSSLEELSNGLYLMMGKETRSNGFLYDNAGALRGELVTNSNYRIDRVHTIDDNLVYNVSLNQIVFVNRQGMITKILNTDGYQMHHDYIYDSANDRFIVLANENGANTIEDIVISVDNQTGAVEELVDIKDLLPEMYALATMDEDGVNSYGGSELDWIHLNSLSLTDEGSLLVSARELSTLIKIDDIDSNPSIDYLIGDTTLYQDTSYSDLLLNKDGDFSIQAGQHTVSYIKDDSLSDDEYYITIYNNNYSNASTRTDFDWSLLGDVSTKYQDDNASSYFYKYLIDTSTNSFSLVQSIELPYSAIVSSVEYIDDNIQTSSGRDGSFSEFDSDGNLIRQYNYEVEKHAYRVMKYSFDIWFA